MFFVIDANIIFSVLIRGEFTLSLLYMLRNAGYKLVTPRIVLEEIEDNKGKILKYSRFFEDEIEFVLNDVLAKLVKPLPTSFFNASLQQASEICSDKDDVPYVALSLALDKAPIWSNDKTLLEDCRKASIKVLSTEDVKSLLGIK